MVIMRHLSIYSSLSLAVVLILLGCMLETQAGVVEDFNHMERCKDSLYLGTPLQGNLLSNSLKKICQRYEDKPRFVTLCNLHKHTQIYSAYTFKKFDGGKRVDFPWMFEPQLASENGSSNMEPFPQSSHIGLLNPDKHQSDPLDMAFTYTMTNVVPQVRWFNRALGRARGPHPQTSQQLLPWQSLCGHQGHDLREHDPLGQCGRPRVHVVGVLLHRLRPERALHRTVQVPGVRGLRAEQPCQQPPGGGSSEEPGEFTQRKDRCGQELSDHKNYCWRITVFTCDTHQACRRSSLKGPMQPFLYQYLE
uniref:Si:dkey-85k7.10 n=1 Tax=Salmo trutta TaxID=8032 RepID=A0A673W899_SALTR